MCLFLKTGLLFEITHDNNIVLDATTMNEYASYNIAIDISKDPKRVMRDRTSACICIYTSLTAVRCGWELDIIKS